MIRIGVLTPHAAAGTEVELPAMAPARLRERLRRSNPWRLRSAVQCSRREDLSGLADEEAGAMAKAQEEAQAVPAA